MQILIHFDFQRRKKSTSVWQILCNLGNWKTSNQYIIAVFLEYDDILRGTLSNGKPLRNSQTPSPSHSKPLCIDYRKNWNQNTNRECDRGLFQLIVLTSSFMFAAFCNWGNGFRKCRSISYFFWTLIEGWVVTVMSGCCWADGDVQMLLFQNYGFATITQPRHEWLLLQNAD